MRTLLHIETGFKLDLEKYTKEDIADIAALIKTEIGVNVGRLTLAKLVNGTVQAASGFEVIEVDIPEQDLGTVKTEDTPVVEPVADPVVETTTVADPVVETTTEDTPVVEPVADPVVETTTEDTPVVDETEGEDDTPSLAADLVAGKLGKGAGKKEFSDTAKRNYTKKSDTHNAVLKTDRKELILALENVGLVFVGSNSGLNRFKFVIMGRETQENKMSRKNPMISIAVRKSGDYAFNLYLEGKSASERNVYKHDEKATEKAETLVAAQIQKLLEKGGEFDKLIG